MDKWLWHARFARTRTAAQRLAISGHVRVNRQKVDSASRPVRPGDVLTLTLGRAVIVLTIVALAARRGSAEAARTLYIQHEPDTSSRRPKFGSPAGQEGIIASNPSAGPRPEARPGKRDRRQAAAMKRQGGEK
ncbi:MAG TPA: RNA-binding S4 domain-containing protein [Afifellaceae bacterium]|nr:RNA-binding S4 domain-containing protein [Afifellaceae bacterium]